MGVPFIVLAVSCIAGIAMANTVPVLMWGPLSQSGPALNDKALDEFVKTVVSSPLTLVFAEDKLSAEDISQCKTDSCFPYLSSASPKAYYAQVLRLVDDLEELVENLFYVYVDKDGNLDKEIPLKAATVVIVSLQDDPELNRAENLVKHDGYIKQIYNDVTSKFGVKKVLALYTGKTSNSLVRKARQAATTAAPAASTASSSSSSSTSGSSSSTTASTPVDTTAVTFSAPELLVHYTSLIFIDGPNQGKTFPEVTGMTISNKTDSSFDVTMPTSAETLTFTVRNTNGYWSVVNVDYGQYVSMVTTRTVGAADGFSYYCGPSTNYTVKTGQSIALVGLQMEPRFGNSTTAKNIDAFSDPYNCVGFTSIPIWTGLFITFMMLFILSIGISWMMDINTMDRFDDPKGKTIIISTTD